MRISNSKQQTIKLINMKNSIKFLLLFIAAGLIFTSCAHVQPIEECIKNSDVIHGFWFGLWNGMTAGFAFIGKLFDRDIAIYATNNNGIWYDFGFILGVGGLFSSGVKSATK